jgi:hypothetical protein
MAFFAFFFFGGGDPGDDLKLKTGRFAIVPSLPCKAETSMKSLIQYSRFQV